MKERFRLALSGLFGFLIVILIALVGWVGFCWWFPPMSVGRVEVPRGASLRQVAAVLSQSNAIRSELVFGVYGKLRGSDQRIRYGTYVFSQPLSPGEILDKLEQGVVELVTFSHAPGWNLFQISESLPAVFPHISAVDWLKAFRDPVIIDRVAPGAGSLEGYLFPDVYRIRPNATAAEVVLTMVRNFQQHFTDDIKNGARVQGLDEAQLVILASIVEKETGVPEERPRIAAVFYNRLRKRMRLQTDPTIIYGMWSRFDGNIRKRDILDSTNRYNTYVINGLPPGPIANPGEEALRAVAFPAEDRSLFFVSRGDGTHHFSRTLQEHNQAVRRYQLRRGGRRERTR